MPHVPESDNLGESHTYPADIVHQIFDAMGDFICIHAVELDNHGNVTDCRLEKWNAAYASVRKSALSEGQSMLENYFTPSIALEHANQAWHEGHSAQLFEMNDTMFELYEQPARKTKFGVRWQRAGDYILEVGTDLRNFVSSEIPSMLAGVKQHDPVYELQVCERLRQLNRSDWEILDLVAEGESDAHISQTVFLNLQTVRNRVSRMLKLFDCENRTQLALLVVHHRNNRLDT